MQTVYLGCLGNGRPGLFTNGMLVLSFGSPEQEAEFHADPDRYCARYGLAYQSGSMWEPIR